MKLALKVAVAVMVAVVLVLAAFAYLRIHREIALFDSDMRRDHVLVGSTLAVSVADAWATDGPERAGDLVRLTDDDREGTHLSWLPNPDSSPQARPAGSYANARVSERSTVRWSDLDAPVHRLAHLSASTQGLVANASGEPYLVSYIPVRHANTLVGTLEILTSYASRDRYVATSIQNTLFATLATTVVATAVMLLLGVWLIGRPMRSLVEKARRVGASDLSGPLQLHQRDEIGLLASEMNAMCEQLANAKATAAAEAAGRLRALEQLRHAERLITVGKLAAGVAHELGTPLNIVSGRAKMIVRQKVTGPTIIDYCQSIADQADRMTRIISQLLDFSRRRGPQLKSIALTEVVRSCAVLLEHMATKHGVSLEVSLDPPVQLLADASQVEQVVTNLLVNALHACSEGDQVQVQVGYAARSPETCVNSDRRWAFIKVADTGCGMSQEVVEHAFEPFFTTKEIGQGSGLGLSVVHGMVEEHGGTIEVKTAVGEGTCFTVYLPVQA